MLSEIVKFNYNDFTCVFWLTPNLRVFQKMTVSTAPKVLFENHENHFIQAARFSYIYFVQANSVEVCATKKKQKQQSQFIIEMYRCFYRCGIYVYIRIKCIRIKMLMIQWKIESDFRKNVNYLAKLNLCIEMINSLAKETLASWSAFLIYNF